MTITAEFPCFTGYNQACYYRPYEDLLDRLASRIGMDHARIAFAVIGDDIQSQTSTRLMSTLLKAYGDDLLRHSEVRNPIATHSRTVGGQ